MAKVTWIGSAATVAQVDSLTPASTIEVGDLFIATINGKSLTYAATNTTIASVCTGFTTAWNASTIPEFAEITAADMTTYIKLTADTAGTPFTVTASTTEANGDPSDAQTFVRANVTPNGSPYDAANTANWSGAALPVNSDEVYFDGAVSKVSCKWNLTTAISGVTLTSLNIINAYSGEIGLKAYNSGNYVEYRGNELTCGITTLNINSTALKLCRINVGSVACAATVINTSTSSETGLNSVQWRGSDSGNTLTVVGSTASVGVAQVGSHTATLATLTQYDGAVTCGLGAAITSLKAIGGTFRRQ